MSLLFQAASKLGSAIPVVVSAVTLDNYLMYGPIPVLPLTQC